MGAIHSLSLCVYVERFISADSDSFFVFGFTSRLRSLSAHQHCMKITSEILHVLKPTAAVAGRPDLSRAPRSLTEQPGK
ncbi:hypothetical protein GBF38_008528 [Nibea albiflora]|uniref:Uncharacterized protein n=1 Tax=Nibea albiflora TaxID=240163 RepID=A0ACB7EYP6_NIBAL|nr:hypothetical protein GBF38_008528 [Nibea albiflora]